VMADRVGLSFASLRLSPLCSESNGVLIHPSLHHFPAFSDGGQGGIILRFSQALSALLRVERRSHPPFASSLPCVQ
jgi:hypothetical protein